MPNSHQTKILASHFNTPSEEETLLFCSVLRAGRIRTAADFRVERDSYVGHDLLLCIGGSGTVSIEGKESAISTGQMAWIDCSKPHAHRPTPDDPWELLWMRASSTQLDAFAAALNVATTPTFSFPDLDPPRAIFERVLALLYAHPSTMNPQLHAEVSTLIALLFASRQSHTSSGSVAPVEDAKLVNVIAELRKSFQQPWQVSDMAKMAGLSAPHFFRCFRKATGSSPMDWLRRERISQAKRKLSESADSIGKIAELVGYNDQFYFSRDFKKIAGVSPRQYRQIESQASQANTQSMQLERTQHIS